MAMGGHMHATARDGVWTGAGTGPVQARRPDLGGCWSGARIIPPPSVGCRGTGSACAIARTPGVSRSAIGIAMHTPCHHAPRMAALPISQSGHPDDPPQPLFTSVITTPTLRTPHTHQE